MLVANQLIPSGVDQMKFRRDEKLWSEMLDLGELISKGKVSQQTLTGQLAVLDRHWPCKASLLCFPALPHILSMQQSLQKQLVLIISCQHDMID